MRVRLPVAAVLCAMLASCSSVPLLGGDGKKQKITLSGEITRADHQTYREIPFTVPRGVTAITVDFAYTGKENRTVIDLGLRDPVGQRGWSGGNKATFTVGEFEATPSYLPGKIQPGEWKLVLGVPNIREGQTARYDADITFSTQGGKKRKVALTTDPVISAKLGWRRGDFHTHTGHSDGSCDDGSGTRKPCALPETAEAARDAKLDFIAITDHNTLSHRDPMRELQSAFPDLLLIPGEEITTFQGHANAIGVTEPLEFALGSPRLPSFDRLLDEAGVQGAFVSINHPGQPSGEVCMGCGWTVKNTDWSRVSAIEAVNGATLRMGDAEGATSGIPFWDALLKRGLRITAIGGSDNHDPTDRTGARQSPVGTPATVVYADALSERGIVEGVRSGRVFIDLTGSPAAMLDAETRIGAQVIYMGGTMGLGPGEQANISFTTSGIPGATIELVSEGLMMVEPDRETKSEVVATVQLGPGARFGYVRAEVRDERGKLLMLGNPVYLRASP